MWLIIVSIYIYIFLKTQGMLSFFVEAGVYRLYNVARKTRNCICTSDDNTQIQ